MPPTGYLAHLNILRLNVKGKVCLDCAQNEMTTAKAPRIQAVSTGMTEEHSFSFFTNSASGCRSYAEFITTVVVLTDFKNRDDRMAAGSTGRLPSNTRLLAGSAGVKHEHPSPLFQYGPQAGGALLIFSLRILPSSTSENRLAEVQTFAYGFIRCENRTLPSFFYMRAAGRRSARENYVVALVFTTENMVAVMPSMPIRAQSCRRFSQLNIQRKLDNFSFTSTITHNYPNCPFVAGIRIAHVFCTNALMDMRLLIAPVTYHHTLVNDRRRSYPKIIQTYE